MLNRRLIRVKVLQALYSYHQSEVKDLKSSQKFLKKSVLGIEDTFINILQFSNEFFEYVKRRHNPSDKHLSSTHSEMNKFRWLSSNKVLDNLLSFEQTASLFNKPSMNWNSDEDFLNSIYKEICSREWFIELVETNPDDFDKASLFIQKMYKYLIEISENFDARMEEVNIHWSDEKIPVLKSIEKLLKSCGSENSTPEIPLLSKDLEDDMEYSERLFETCVLRHDELEKMISIKTPEWDPKRIARIDLYIMVMALVEFTEFPSIPVKVTINEYLELAKIYSTPQSSKFINGILDKMLNDLKSEGKVVKKGRGLVE
ncbi:MAG: transcription antitermination factor NusB [Flavobacteriales bacterium]|nr:transcription antitermination factor NusB [Flavobacteriales bacterium]